MGIPPHDAEGRLSGTYNAFGYNVKGSSYSNFFDSSGLWLGNSYGASILHLGQRIFALVEPSTTQFVHENALGSTGMGTDPGGNPAGDLLFYPWGQSWLGTNGGEEHWAGFQNRGSDLQGGRLVRAYQDVYGRWLTPDPLAGDVTNPQSLNRYAYALNNPTTLTDPSGLDACAGATDPRVCWQQTYWGLAGFPLGELEPFYGSDEFDSIFGDAGDSCSNAFFAESNVTCGNSPVIGASVGPWGGGGGGTSAGNAGFPQSGIPGNAGFPQIGGIPQVAICLIFPLACVGASETGMPLISLPLFGPDVYGMNDIVAGSVPQTTTQTQHTHFWQKPGCLGAIAVTAVGAAATAGEVLAVMTLAPEVGAVLADAVAEDAVLGVVHAGEIASLGVAALLAAPTIALAGAASVAATCF